MWFPIGTNAMTAGAPTEFGIGVGTIVLDANVVFLALLHVRLPLAAAPGRRRARRHVRATGAQDRLRVRELPQPLAHELGVDRA